MKQLSLVLSMLFQINSVTGITTKYNYTAYCLNVRVFLNVAPMAWYNCFRNLLSPGCKLEHLNIDVAGSTKGGKFTSNYTASHTKNSQLHCHSCTNEDIRVYLIQQKLTLSTKQLEAQEKIYGTLEESKNKYISSYYKSFWNTAELAKNLHLKSGQQTNKNGDFK